MNKGYYYIIPAIVIWAVSSGVWVKFVKVEPFTFYWIGALFGILFILLSLLFTKKLIKVFSYSRTIMLRMLMVGFFMGVSNALFYIALKSGTVANAVLSHSLFPVFTALIFAPILLKERLTPKQTLILILSFCGLVVLVWPSFSGFDLDPAIIFGTISAFVLSLSNTLEKSVANQKMEPLVSVFYKNLIPLIVFLPFVLPVIKDGVALDDILLIAFWGIAVLGVSFVLFFVSGISEVSFFCCSG